MTTPRDPHRRPCEPRPGFTLTELLVVIMVITILASMVLFALAGAQEQSREKRARAQIARLNELLMDRWQSYQTRRVVSRNEQNLIPGANPRVAALDRLRALRELMRMEMPDRYTDIFDDPVVLRQRPALSWAYLRRVPPVDQLTPEQLVRLNENQGAECLYLIVSRIQVGNTNALEFFHENELGDVDRDGMPEILDAWGTPIRWLRWPAGFVPEDGNTSNGLQWPTVVSSLQDGNPENGRDPFIPAVLLSDTRFMSQYILYPLIISAGPDRQFDMAFDAQQALHYAAKENDPYAGFGDASELVGGPVDANGDNENNAVDNIHNHLPMVR